MKTSKRLSPRPIPASVPRTLSDSLSDLVADTPASKLTFSQRRAVLAIVEYQTDNDWLGLAHSFDMSRCFPSVHQLPARLFVQALAFHFRTLEFMGVLKPWQVAVALRF